MMEFSINVKVTGLDGLANAILALTQQQAPVAPVQTTTPAPAPIQQAVTPVTPVAVPAQQAVTPAPAPVQAAVPVAGAPSYTLDDLCKAAMPLMDAGRQSELIQLIQGFGVTSLPELPQGRYGDFATALRQMQI